MPKRRRVITGKFEAISDNGEKFIVIERTLFIRVVSFRSRPEEKAGPKEYIIIKPERMHVNVVDEKVEIYEIVETGIKIRKLKKPGDTDS